MVNPKSLWSSLAKGLVNPELKLLLFLKESKAMVFRKVEWEWGPLTSSASTTLIVSKSIEE